MDVESDMKFYFEAEKIYDVGQEKNRLEKIALTGAKCALYDGAGLLRDKIREKVPVSHGLPTSGSLRNSLDIMPFKVDADSVRTCIGYDGYKNETAKKNAYSMIARTLNKRGIHKGFYTKIARVTKPLVERKIAQTFDEKVAKLIEGINA